MARVGIIRAWFLFALVVLIESKVRKPARLPEDVPLKPPAQKPRVPAEPAAEIRSANFRAHFKKRGKKCTNLRVNLEFSRFSRFSFLSYRCPIFTGWLCPSTDKGPVVGVP